MISVITIDGPAGSGKTTLAGLIEACLSDNGDEALVVHLDDLYNGWEDALGTSLTLVLENILEDYSQGRELTIPQYDWALRRFIEPRLYPNPDILILEGVGSGQRATRPYAEIKLWVEAPANVALSRVLERDGEEIRSEMELWQIREQEHFAREETASAADYKVKSAP